MMYKPYDGIYTLLLILILYSCSKKTYLGASSTPTEIKTDTAIKRDSAFVRKPVIKKKPQVPIPKVIAVNDKAASKSVDGRYYYDLQGHRYWRNNKDGKYYLYNKSMNTDKDFKAN